ncbi:MAG TPA: right-handed parallel beta-helix repeat-containing protein [Thermoanaerobaculia bacterium]|jgi:parallel beta-helix repeat protein|nr:right-handed parallel beta-helix repeat-containing protein [Thermoanaerobaculia bacterium]
MRFHVALCVALLAFPAFATNVTVGCAGGPPGDYPTIAAAIAALDLDGPHTITVSGTCSESVLLDQRERLTIQGPATVSGGAQPAFVIRNSGHILLQSLTTSGLRAAISIENRSSVTLIAVIAENATNGFAVDAFGGAAVNVNGPSGAPSIFRNSANGMRCENCVAFFSGFVTIENNTNVGLLIDSGRVETSGQQPAWTGGPAQGGPTIIRNNFNGVSVTSGGHFEMGRHNLIEDNTASGIILTSGTASLFGFSLPDGTPSSTTIQGNDRNAVSALFNSTFRAQGPTKFLNNGAAAVQFRAGVSLTHSSVVILSGATISGSVGPGISLDSTSNARLDGTTISGNSEEAVRLAHGSLLESIAGNNIPAPSVTCDGTSIVFGDLSGVAAFECAKDKKK